jgi:hypothetical protein
MHSDLAEVTASGAFHWNDGNIGGIGSNWDQTDTTLGYGQTYQFSGWTVLPSSDGTRFTNDGTGHGMFVSVDNRLFILIERQSVVGVISIVDERPSRRQANLDAAPAAPHNSSALRKRMVLNRDHLPMCVTACVAW